MDKNCCWCGSKSAKQKTGFIPYHFSHIDKTVYFCSKKCLSEATIDGKGKILDAEKWAMKKCRDIQKQKLDIKNALMQKDKLSNEDLGTLFSCLSAKQKKLLAVVGLANISWSVHGNPVQLIKKINDGVKEL